MSIAHARQWKRRRKLALERVASGQLPLREAVWDGHKALQTCPVYMVLEAAPNMGPAKTRIALERAQVWPLVALGELDEAQRTAVLTNLPRRVR